MCKQGEGGLCLLHYFYYLILKSVGLGACEKNDPISFLLHMTFGINQLDL